MFLLDTMVLSELAKPEERRHAIAAQWLSAAGRNDILISVVTIGEIERGIEKQRKNDPPHARRLERWLGELLVDFAESLLPVDVPIARRWGRLSQRIGHRSLDLAIAATALEHGLTVATRNAAHFKPTGVKTVDPFAG